MSAAPIPARTLRAQQGRRDRRLSRYESVMELVRNGLSQAEISRRLGNDRRTIRRWTRSGGFPERKPVFRRKSIDDHRRYLDQRWEEGCHNASQLWRELRERGFTGMDGIVRNWVRQRYGRRSTRVRKETVTPQLLRVSPRQTTWQILKPSESGKPYLEELYRRCPEIATAAGVAQEFFRIVQQRDLPAWARWREAARHTPLASFARHLCRDEAAVKAALEHKWSNGHVEGNVHRLKMIKWSMYGRASFDLLRLRVLATG